MVIFASIAALVLLLVYFVMRVQSLQKELVLSQSNLKASNRRISDSTSGMVMLAKQIQHFLVERLESSHKRGLIDTGAFEVFQFVFHNISTIAVLCMDKGMTVEEALKSVLQESEITMESIREKVKLQPSEIRVAWSQNTLEGFVVACKGISFPVTKTESASS
ncbi:MAG TPA: hypothetical protein DEH24_01435 [Alteromonas sp.]|nr:hypothetical protein [Alteromonadaceae bacterium]MAX42586.1 hypothetical protein [Alteromonadaceae bacterium]HBY38045.1 hypothetical protein [Alteromonas sp.]|tara:strand:+ start:86794 stop:87282 length:489 start_codon:yes stop_codon:yes gene_type:complete